MIVLATSVSVKGLSGLDVTRFLCGCGDAEYQAWWPGTHFRFHTAKGDKGAVGSTVFMDEFVATYLVRGHAILRQHIPAKRLSV